MRFTISGMYLAAVTIRDDDYPEGDWYTTITDEASERLPSGDHEWSHIAEVVGASGFKADHQGGTSRWYGLVRR